MDSLKSWSRLMRVYQEVMYPKEVKMHNVVTIIVSWEAKWGQMMKESEDDAKILAVWKIPVTVEL